MMPPGLRTRDLERLTLVSDPHVSCDGVVAFVRSRLDSSADMTRHEVALARAAGTVPQLPAASDAWCPRWSPDGARLAIVSTVSGQVQAATWADGSWAMSALAPVPGRVTDLDWSPDGQFLAVTAVARESPGGGAWIMQPAGPARLDGTAGLACERRRVWILPADGSPGLELAVDHRDDAWQPRWSAEGTRLAFLRGSPGGPVLLCVAAAPWSAGPLVMTQVAAGAVTFGWSPDGAEIAYLAPRPGEFPDVECRLYRCNAAGDGEPAELAASWDRSLGSTVRGDDARGTSPCPPLWSAATGRIYFCVADGGQGSIGWSSPGSGAHGIACGGLRTCLEPSLSGDGRRIAFVSTDPSDPGTVCTVDLDTGAELRLSRGDPWLAAAVAPTALVTVRGQDGVPLEGWLTMPAGRDSGALPLIVSLHGGPHYPVGWRFCFETQRLAALGYAVLAPNPRGSGGYGRDFATAIRGQWGSPAWQDVSCLMDAAMGSYAIDRDRVAVTGVSYGGFLSLHAITVSPQVRTAICENGISNLLALWGSGAEDPDWLTAEMRGTPWERTATYVQTSPLTAAARITAPVLLIHAELDQNCPISQSEQMLAAIRRCGGEAQLLRLEGEGHLVNLVGRPSRRFARSQAVDQWLDRYLSPSPAGPGAGPDRSQQDVVS